MDKHTEIPSINGLYWYYESGQCTDNPEPVKIYVGRYGKGNFKGFNGRTQSWMREGEFLVGPQLPPAN